MSLDTSRREESAQSSSHIRIRNLTKTFANGSIVAVDDVSLDIDSSEFVVLLGPSGCGKTTTLRCIAGLEDPDSGEIFIGDENITHKKPKDRNLAFVFQSIALFPHMSVKKNISFGLDMTTGLDSEKKDNRVRKVAELLGIEELLDRSPSELSGGQQQRVSLGRAMVMEPDAFLLDEPFSALDANLRDQMRVETKQLQRRLETAMIFVTHDQEEAMTLGDTIVVMNDGSIKQIGSPYEIYNDPKNLFVAQFIGSPSPNFFECEVHTEGTDVTLDAGFFDISLSRNQVEQFDGTDGQTVTFGIRPEYLETNASDPLFEAELSVIEPHGDRDAVHLLGDGDVEITAVTDQEAVAREQDTVPVSFDRDKLWLFNQDGDRLL